MTRPVDKLRAGLCAALLAALALPCAASAGGANVTGGAAVTPVATKPTGGAAVAAPRVPAITGVACVSSCGAAHTVHIGGTIVLRGRNLAVGNVVLFPLKVSGVTYSSKVSAKISRTRGGLTVAIPGGAHTGKIVVVAAAKLRSKPYGPIRLLPAPRVPVSVTGGAGPTAPPAPSTGSPTGTAFDGAGMWIWYLSASDGGSIPAIVAQAKAAGITTLYVKSSDGASNYWSQFSSALVTTLHAAGLRVCAWQYVYGTQPAGEAALGARAVAAGADCLVIDAESEYEGEYAAAQTYITDLRAAVGASYPVGLTSFPYVDYHETFPYSVFLAPGGAQFNVPQVYWHDIGDSVDYTLAHTYHENRVYGRTIVPLGETYGGTPPADIFRFRQLAGLYGAPGLSWWDWQETPAAGWAALTQPLTPLTATTADTSWPSFSQGAKGDQVLWMQEHLAAAEPQTPTSGVFDSTTAAALVAFQAAHGLPQSGATDVATWQALLALTPVSVTWTGSSAPAG